MFKKIINIAISMIIGILLLPVIANAEVIKKGDIVHTFTDIEEYTCSNVTGEGSLFIYDFHNGKEILAYVENNIISDVYYYNLDGTCSEITDEQYLDYLNKETIDYHLEETETSIKLYKRVNHHRNWYNVYALTEDVSLDPNKTYYDVDGYTVRNPVVEDIATYYEETNNYYVNPSNYEIDPNIDYYDQKLSDTFEKVTNPTIENILEYYVIVPEEELATSTLVRTINLTNGKAKLDTFFNDLDIDDYTMTPTIILGEIYIVARDSSLPRGSYMNYYFDENFDLIEEFTGYDYIEELTSKLMCCYDEDEEILDIYDYNREKIKTIEHFVGLGDEVRIYLDPNYINIGYIVNEGAKRTVIYSYELLSDDNINYDDDDISFRFSGILRKLSKVKVNDVELDGSKFTETSGSTIITLKKDYLEKLNSGSYTLKVEFNDEGYSESTFIIPISNPNTGDNIINSIILGSVSLICLLGFCLIVNRNKRIN